MKQMKARLALCFGGRIAEQLIYGIDALNTGASNDIQQATDMARAMVMEYGMSREARLAALSRQSGGGLPRPQRRRAARTSPRRPPQLIDQEIRRLIEEAEGVARKVLTDNLDELHRLATRPARI